MREGLESELGNLNTNSIAGRTITLRVSSAAGIISLKNECTSYMCPPSDLNYPYVWMKSDLALYDM